MSLETYKGWIIAAVAAVAFIVWGLRRMGWKREQPDLDGGPEFGVVGNCEVRVVHERDTGTDRVGIVVTVHGAEGGKYRHYHILTTAQARDLAGWLRRAAQP